MRFIVLFSILFLSIGCTNFFSKKDNNKNLIYLIGLNIVSSIPDAYARLFYINPLLINDPTNLSYLIDYSLYSSETSKKKIIFVHGWNTLDSPSPSYPSENEMKQRILSQWSHILSNTSSFLSDIAYKKKYDIYFFTYLTSSSIEGNGIRFRNRLDSAFKNQSSNTYIFAHSMGGLISRIALYQESSPDYLAKIISSGTPYHGSPWSSLNFQNNSGTLGDIAKYITNTDGGKDLAWDNFDNSIQGASNTILSKYNSNTSRDSIITAYYGSISSILSYVGTDFSLLPGCTSLGVTYSPSDCIVPQSSAIFNKGGVSQSIDIGKYHHIDLNLRVDVIKNQLILDLP